MVSVGGNLRNGRNAGFHVNCRNRLDRTNWNYGCRNYQNSILFY
nr:MAG TPA: hypothetical protein [Caudoviricetes sp.]